MVWLKQPKNYRILRIHLLGTMNFYTKYLTNPSNRCWEIGGAKGKVRASLESVDFFLWGPWMSVLNVIVIHPILQSGPTCWTNQSKTPIPRATPLAWLQTDLIKRSPFLTEYYNLIQTLQAVCLHTFHTIPRCYPVFISVNDIQAVCSCKEPPDCYNKRKRKKLLFLGRSFDCDTWALWFHLFVFLCTKYHKTTHKIWSIHQRLRSVKIQPSNWIMLNGPPVSLFPSPKRPTTDHTHANTHTTLSCPALPMSHAGVIAECPELIGL